MWAEAGSRPWGQCREFERQAERVLQSPNVRGDDVRGPGPWADRAELCPGVPAVLAAAAYFELMLVPPLPPLGDLVEEVKPLLEAHRTSRQRAARWLATARRESARKGDPPPPLTWFLSAQSALGLGEPAAARRALAEADARGEVEPWRLDRLGALTALLAGDLPPALELGYRARELGPAAERGTSTFLLALIYDRAGAPDAAVRELAAVRAASFGFERSVIDTLLPLHERIYLQALEQIALRNPGNATWLLKSYLACPAVEAPERRMAERRIEELRPT